MKIFDLVKSKDTSTYQYSSNFIYVENIKPSRKYTYWCYAFTTRMESSGNHEAVVFNCFLIVEGAGYVCGVIKKR